MGRTGLKFNGIHVDIFSLYKQLRYTLVTCIKCLNQRCQTFGIFGISLYSLTQQHGRNIIKPKPRAQMEWRKWFSQIVYPSNAKAIDLKKHKGLSCTQGLILALDKFD